jgi:Xaa-Pro dipeptidase
VHDLKMVKSAREIALVREAGRIADLGMDACVRSIAEGRSELEVAGAVYHAMLSAGGGLPASAINLVTGDRMAFSHGSPTSRRLGRGEAGNVEFGAAYKRYTATIGRVFCLGKPAARMRELHEVVRRAGDAGIAAMRPGVAATVPHEAARRVIAEAGFDRHRCHTTAYGVAPGFPPYWGEPIHIFAGSRYTLQAGMVFSVVPPIFIGEERVGARITDTVLVTENGAERISRHSRDLIVVE